MADGFAVRADTLEELADLIDVDKEQFLKDMEGSYRHKFAKKPQVVEGNLKCLREAMDEVKG